MNRIGTLAIATVIIGNAWTQAIAQTAKEFVGTWTLVSSATEREGVKSDTFGPNPKGLLVFDASGRYVITFFAANLPKFASNNRASGTADENKAIVTGSLAHFGTYTVNEADKSFTFHIENATFPNWDNTEQKRAFVISGDELKYTTPVASAGGTATLIWKRAK
jgi:Lipocalin-like domain